MPPREGEESTAPTANGSATSDSHDGTTPIKEEAVRSDQHHDHHHHHHHHFGLSETLKKSMRSIIGTSSTLKQGQSEVRPKKQNISFPPTAHWWEPPLYCWFYEANREILAIFVVYNTLIVFLARYTNLCGDSVPGSNHVFCADDFMMLEDRALTGFAVGMFLLLSFRANQAYDRFWEGRKMWGRMKEVSRDFARLVCSHVTVSNHDDFLDRRRAIDFVTAFAAAVKLHLRGEKDIARDIKELGVKLCVQDVANIQHAHHMPLFCQDILSNYLSKQYKAGKLSDYQLGVINSTSLAVMSDTMGSCERIANTPIPLSYVLQLRFFLMLWLIMYPLHVVAYYGWWTLLLTNLVAFAVLGIEAMASEIENPFGHDRNDLDLDNMVAGFYKDTQAILHRTESHHSNLIFDRKSVESMSKGEGTGAASEELNDEETIDFTAPKLNLSHDALMNSSDVMKTTKAVDTRKPIVEKTSSVTFADDVKEVAPLPPPPPVMEEVAPPERPQEVPPVPQPMSVDESTPAAASKDSDETEVPV